MVSVIKVKTIEEIKEIKNTEKSLSIVISRHDLNETQIKELSEILLNTSNAPIYQFKMEHIYRDRVLKTKAEKVLEEKMKELNFNENYMNILNYIDFNNPQYKNISIIKYCGLGKIYPSVKIPINELKKIYRNLKNGNIENSIKLIEKYIECDINERK